MPISVRHMQKKSRWERGKITEKSKENCIEARTRQKTHDTRHTTCKHFESVAELHAKRPESMLRKAQNHWTANNNGDYVPRKSLLATFVADMWCGPKRQANW